MIWWFLVYYGFIAWLAWLCIQEARRRARRRHAHKPVMVPVAVMIGCGLVALLLTYGLLTSPTVFVP